MSRRQCAGRSTDSCISVEASSWPTSIKAYSTGTGAPLGEMSPARLTASLVTCEKTVRCLGCVASDPATHTGAFSTMLSRSRTSQNIQVGDGSGRHGQNGGAGGTFRQVCLALEINDQIERVFRPVTLSMKSSICPKASTLWLCKGLVNLSAMGHNFEMVVSPSSSDNGRRLMKSNQIISRPTQTRFPCCCVRELHRPASSPSMSSSWLVAMTINMSITDADRF